MFFYSLFFLLLFFQEPFTKPDYTFKIFATGFSKKCDVSRQKLLYEVSVYPILFLTLHSHIFSHHLIFHSTFYYLIPLPTSFPFSSFHSHSYPFIPILILSFPFSSFHSHSFLASYPGASPRSLGTRLIHSIS